MSDENKTSSNSDLCNSNLPWSPAWQRKVDLLRDKLATGAGAVEVPASFACLFDASLDPRLGKEFVLIGAHLNSTDGGTYLRVEDVLRQSESLKKDAE